VVAATWVGRGQSGGGSSALATTEGGTCASAAWGGALVRALPAGIIDRNGWSWGLGQGEVHFWVSCSIGF
jgi:hypothetical protein